MRDRLGHLAAGALAPRGGRPRPRRAAGACARSGRCRARRIRPRACVDGCGERAEHGDLLGARRAQVLLEQGAALGVEVVAGGREHLGGVRARSRRPGRCGSTVSAGARVVGEGVGDVRGRVGGGQSGPRARGRPSATAIAAAIVVLPTPPLPIVMTTPCPWRASSSISASERRRSGGVSAVVAISVDAGRGWVASARGSAGDPEQARRARARRRAGQSPSGRRASRRARRAGAAEYARGDGVVAPGR